jgi:hypothetical protein
MTIESHPLSKFIEAILEAIVFNGDLHFMHHAFTLNRCG